MAQVKVNGKMVDIHPRISPIRAVDILDMAMAQGAMPKNIRHRDYYLHESIVRKAFFDYDIVDTQKYNRFLTLRNAATTAQ